MLFLGKFIEHIPIENRLKSFIDSKIINDCVLVGEGLNCLVALFAFKTIKKTAKLQEPVIQWLKKLGSTSKNVDDITDYKDKAVRNEILRIIAQVKTN